MCLHSVLNNPVPISCGRGLISRTRWMQAEYPAPLAVLAAEALLKKTPSSCQAEETANRGGQNMLATMSYLHRISDNVKTVGAQAIISVVFTASNKHAKL